MRIHIIAALRIVKTRPKAARPKARGRTRISPATHPVVGGARRSDRVRASPGARPAGRRCVWSSGRRARRSPRLSPAAGQRRCRARRGSPPARRAPEGRRSTRGPAARRHAWPRSADSAPLRPRAPPRASSRFVLRRASTSSPRRCAVTNARITAAQLIRLALTPARTRDRQLQVKPGPSAVSTVRLGSPAATSRSRTKSTVGGRHVSILAQHLTLVIERPPARAATSSPAP